MKNKILYWLGLVSADSLIRDFHSLKQRSIAKLLHYAEHKRIAVKKNDERAKLYDRRSFNANVEADRADSVAKQIDGLIS